MATMTLSSESSQQTALKTVPFFVAPISGGPSLIWACRRSVRLIPRRPRSIAEKCSIRFTSSSAKNASLCNSRNSKAPKTFFSDYLYFSSYSDSWLKHCEKYTAKVTERFGLGAQSFVVEVASNDGYLLQYFVKRGVPVLGIEPAAKRGQSGGRKGCALAGSFFFGTQLALELAGKGKNGGPDYRQQCVGAGAGHQ